MGGLGWDAKRADKSLNLTLSTPELGHFLSKSRQIRPNAAQEGLTAFKKKKNDCVGLSRLN